MNTIKNIFLAATLSIFAIPFTSCDEASFLEETPLDIKVIDNALVTTEQFQMATNNNYDKIRDVIINHPWNTEDQWLAIYYSGDLAYFGAAGETPRGTPGGAWQKLNNYEVEMLPTFGSVGNWWDRLYSMVYVACQILDRLEVTTEVPADKKAVFRGESLFFRAYAYRNLTNLYGGVPIIRNEVVSPKRDYVRSTREECYDFARIDLEEAVTLLPDIDKARTGQISKQAALHLLSEIYICLKQHQKAVDAATEVINNPALSLMTTRFGNQASEPGDVYWDLFRQNNQNRTSGNKEGLWVLQYEFQKDGGGNNGYRISQVYPAYSSLQTEGVNLFAGPTAEKGGRGSGWLKPTDYFYNQLWAKDGTNDIRNSPYNIVRDLKIDNPDHPGFGEMLVADGWVEKSAVSDGRTFYPLLTKLSSLNKMPAISYQMKDGAPEKTVYGEQIIQSGNDYRSCYKDEYLMRLAETYLLRAEAYLGLGNKQKATDDVNIIRSRAQATPATVAEMDIDYILDERLRELYFEELRNVTLCRLGKLSDRASRYNYYSGYSIKAYHNLWPIPFKEIERNTGAVLEQNPGYN